MTAKQVSPHEHRRVVLVVEDEPIIRLDIAEELRRLGHQVIETVNADEAMTVLRSTARIDVVVTDVRMPGKLDGLDLARTVRQERPGVLIVVMSGHLTALAEHKQIMDLLVSKPTPSDQLARTITRLFDA